MKTRLMRHVAVCAIALTPSLAFAQAPNGGERGGPAAGAGAERGGAMERSGGEKGTPGQAKERPGAAASAPAASGESGEKNKNAPHQAGHEGNGEKAGTRAPEQAGGKPGETGGPKGEGQRSESQKGEAGHNGAADRKGEPGRTGAQGDHSNANGHRSVQVTSEQKTRITTTIRSQHVQALHGVSFAVRAGTIVPTQYEFHPLPPEIITIVPDYRGYDYILVDEEIIIIEPGTRRIVDIIG